MIRILTRSLLAAVAVALLVPASAAATGGDRVDLPLRGQTIAVTIYRPSLPPSKIKGTILMGSGDVGWVGLAASMADFLSNQGYVVVGINVRNYLSAFTTRRGHLETPQVPDDYAQIAAYVRSRGLLVSPVIVSGVSEGAALAVLAASSPANHGLISGVITMGLPGTAELAWRWTDFTTWITKKDSAEPSFAAKDFIGRIAPIPLCMIQSTKDEYVTEREYRELEAAAREPKKLALIDASNHRFTDKMDDLRREYLAALAWIAHEP